MTTTLDRTMATLGGLPAGTIVLTLAGALPVEHLVPGDRIVTRDGARTLLGIEAQVEAVAHMVRVTDSALGMDQPASETLIEAGQSVLMRDWRAMAFTGRHEAAIPAHRLVDGEFVRDEWHVGMRLFRLAFSEPVTVMAAGLELCALPQRETV